MTNVVITTNTAPDITVGVVAVPGPQGPPGATGGQGLPVGGTTGQVLAKSSNVNYASSWIDKPGVTDGDKGDITVSSSGTVWVIDSHAVTNAKLAQVPPAMLKGNPSGTTADVQDIPIGTVKSMLALTKADVGLGNVDNTADAAKPISTAQSTVNSTKADKSTFVSVTTPLTGGGDISANRTIGIANFAGGVPGAVPASSGGTANFLRADGTWAPPPGGGTLTSAQVASMLQQVVLNASDPAPGPGVWLRRP